MQYSIPVAVMPTGALRFFRLVPHHTTPHSRLLNIESLVVSLLREPDIARCLESQLNRTWNQNRVSQTEDDVYRPQKLDPFKSGEPS